MPGAKALAVHDLCGRLLRRRNAAQLELGEGPETAFDRRASILKDLKKDLYFQAAPLTSSNGVPDGATAFLGGRF